VVACDRMADASVRLTVVFLERDFWPRGNVARGSVQAVFVVRCYRIGLAAGVLQPSITRVGMARVHDRVGHRRVLRMVPTAVPSDPFATHRATPPSGMKRFRMVIVSPKHPHDGYHSSPDGLRLTAQR